MRALIQRVRQASVTIDNKITAAIGAGVLVFVGVEDADTKEDIQWLCTKIANLRIFDDADAVPNLSVRDIGGEVLIVSQFTLHANVKKGNRPSYIKASKPAVAIPLYEAFVKQMTAEMGKPVSTGSFGADMKIGLVNDGPLTIIVDTKNKDF